MQSSQEDSDETDTDEMGVVIGSGSTGEGRHGRAGTHAGVRAIPWSSRRLRIASRRGSHGRGYAGSLGREACRRRRGGRRR